MYWRELFPASVIGRRQHILPVVTRGNTILRLFVVQALFQSSTSLAVAISGLVGLLLAPDRSLATLPAATTVVAAAAAMIPASLLMQRAGRRTGFLLGVSFGIAAALLATMALYLGSFWLFVMSTLLAGVYQAFAQYYRFAAADAAAPTQRARAISWVVAGGVVAAFLGPALVRWTEGIGTTPFAAAYLASSALGVLAGIVLLGTRFTAVTPVHARSSGRKIRQIMRQDTFRRAVVSSAVGYAVMALVMHATPISMFDHGHGLAASATVIQWHVLGMFVPSFFTGGLITRFGVKPVVLAGIAANLVHTVIALSGQEYLQYLSGLTLLGIGWNFMFIGGTTMLTQAYRPEERARTQAAHDFLVFVAVSAASFSAGGLLNAFGWQAVNIAAMCLMLVPLAYLLWPVSARRLRVAD